MLNHILGSGRVAASRVRAEHLHLGVEGISSCRVENYGHFMKWRCVKTLVRWWILKSAKWIYMDVDQRSPKIDTWYRRFYRTYPKPIPKYGSVGIFALWELAILSDLSGDELGRGWECACWVAWLVFEMPEMLVIFFHQSEMSTLSPCKL